MEEKKKQVLVIASVASMIGQFNMPNIELLLRKKYEVIVACNFVECGTFTQKDSENLKSALLSLGVKIYQVDFARNVFNFSKHSRALKQIKKIIKENSIGLVHCHSPIGGFLTRLAFKKQRHKNGVKVIYTAHGFHFFKGSPLSSWLIFYPIERKASRWTDVLVTINKEDFEIANKKMYAKKVLYIPGVGIDYDRFAHAIVEREKLRQEIGIPADAFLIISVGELCDRKNHKVIIEALNKIQNPDFYYIVAGKGELERDLIELINKRNLAKNVKLLGYRNDVEKLYKISDVCAFPSKREGLGLAGLEAMAAGLPLVSSNLNGIMDYAQNGVTGFCLDPSDIDGYAQSFLRLYNDKDLRRKMAIENKTIAKDFSLTKSLNLIDAEY